MENINIKINGMEVSAPAGSTILEAARIAGIDIPTLCYLKDINEIGACRMCVVEVNHPSAGERVQKENPAVESFRTREKMSVLYQKRGLRTAESV